LPDGSTTPDARQKSRRRASSAAEVPEIVQDADLETKREKRLRRARKDGVANFLSTRIWLYPIV
jgi:hypothetical protein